MDSKRYIYKLNNGIRLLIVPQKTKLVNITINILLGQRHESKKEMELTHYIEHLMGRFTSEKYKDMNYISTELTKRGAITNASVDEYNTKFYIKGLYDDAEFYIDLLSNTIKDFHINNKILVQEKNAVIQELRNIISHSEYMFYYKIYEYISPKYAYIEDYKKHIKFIKNYDVNKLKDFIKEHINLDNIVIETSCPLDKLDDIRKLLKKYFNFEKPNTKFNIEYPNENFKNNGLKILYIKKKKKDDNVILSLQLYDNIKKHSNKHISLTFLNYICFNFNTGIFYKILREKLGLIYNISLQINIDNCNHKMSNITINTSVFKKNITILIKNILDILHNINITDDDINMAKNNLKIKFEFMKFISLDTKTEYYGEYMIFNKDIIPYDVIHKKYLDIDNKEIIKNINYFKKKLIKDVLIFYFSNNNLNKLIDKELNNSNIKYLSL